MREVKLDKDGVLPITATEQEFNGGIRALIQGYPFGDAIRSRTLTVSYDGDTATMNIVTPENLKLFQSFLNEYHTVNAYVYDRSIKDIRIFRHDAFKTNDGGYDLDAAAKIRNSVIKAAAIPNQPTASPVTRQAPTITSGTASNSSQGKNRLEGK